MRPIMNREELASHKAVEHGRDYSRSCDGYEDMEVAREDGWQEISGWGKDGWDLGEWPYVVIYVHKTNFNLRQIVEGDTTIWNFDNIEDRNAAIDYLFIWYGIGKGYEPWKAAGLSDDWDGDNRDYPTRVALDAGTLNVPDEYRGPYSRREATA